MEDTESDQECLLAEHDIYFPIRADIWRYFEDVDLDYPLMRPWVWCSYDQTESDEELERVATLLEQSYM